VEDFISIHRLHLILQVFSVVQLRIRPEYNPRQDLRQLSKSDVAHVLLIYLVVDPCVAHFRTVHFNLFFELAHDYRLVLQLVEVSQFRPLGSLHTHVDNLPNYDYIICVVDNSSEEPIKLSEPLVFIEQVLLYSVIFKVLN